MTDKPDFIEDNEEVVEESEFFIADTTKLISCQLDLASMEFPLFALRSGDKITRTFDYKGTTIEIDPSLKYGLASMGDKDIWVFCISKLMQAIKEGNEASRTVIFSATEYLTVTNRGTGGRQYKDIHLSLKRLKGTNITTNIKTGDVITIDGFGLIHDYKTIEDKSNDSLKISVTLPEWLYRSILSKSVLTISKEYFSIQKPLEKRIYEIGRKHCGYKEWFHISFELLLLKSGSTTNNLARFKHSVKEIVDRNQLPEFYLKIEGKNLAYYRRDKTELIDGVIYSRLGKKEDKKPKVKELPVYEKPTEPKEEKKVISKETAGSMARTGESWESLYARLESEGYTVKR